ncbi:hypothetical protein ACFV9C_38020 [Kribbella sp. NPDC059898]|uniref:hypothetical protein n=1 Tax=Kribbella sp. NPDC059898 TaxID=3346995 RepID=UPI00365634FD
MRVIPPAFEYFAPAELVIAGGCVLAGLLLCAWFVRRPAEPRALTLLRLLQTGSVNDYAAYSAVGLLICAAALAIT